MDSGGPPGRLRGELTEFVGRRAELALARQALVASRLFTLTGLGGIGKTRLALPAVDGARRAFRDGAWLAELGGLHDPALLVPEVARSPAPSDQPGHRTGQGTGSDASPRNGKELGAHGTQRNAGTARPRSRPKQETRGEQA